MTMTYIGLRGNTYELETSPMASGGEGEVFGVLGKYGAVAKIYKKDYTIPDDREEKLRLLVDSNISNMKEVAWATDVLYDANRQFCGFVMPRMDFNADIGKLYGYPENQDSLEYNKRVIIGKYISLVISRMHKLGYIFGDFNPNNIGVNVNTGNISFLDTDSYHIPNSSQKDEYYRCVVMYPGYVAPELLLAMRVHEHYNPADKKDKKTLARMKSKTFTQETDNFALAVHIGRLLLNGFSPFNGIPIRSPHDASPGQGHKAVRDDNYCFKPGYKPKQVQVPPLDVFPQEIAELFNSAFIRGKDDPRQRPSAEEWHNALERYENNLKQCRNNHLHWYDSKNKVCPYCEANKRYQLDNPGLSPLPQATALPLPVQKQPTPPPQQAVSPPPLSPIQTLNSVLWMFLRVNPVPPAPRGLDNILCLVCSVILLVGLLILNIATLISPKADSTLMETLCFLGAFNITALVPVAIPILLFMFPKERTLWNVMLGMSAAALFIGVLIAIHNFYYYYGFAISP